MKSLIKISVFFLLLVSIQTARAEWTKQNSNTLAWLYDIYFLNEQKGFTVGSSGTFLTTIDGGKTWTKKRNFTDDTIRQIYFADEKIGWLLCERNQYSLGSNAPSYLMKTVDGGDDWERVEFNDGERKRVTKFFFTKKGAGFALGEGGAVLQMSSDEQKWKRAALPVRYLMFDGLFTDDLNGVIVGAGGSILMTADAGLSWEKSSIFGTPEAKLAAVFFINPKNGWTVGANGKIFQTVNGGKIWREQKSNVTKDLTDIYFKNTAEGWAIGDEGAILYTMTAGNVWTTINSNARHRLEKIFFNGEKGWAVGFGGTILSYEK